MNFKSHVMIGFIFSYILIYFFNFSIFSGIIIFLSSWLIDIDHYFWYGFEMKSWNPIESLKWYNQSVPKWKSLSLKERNKFKRGVFIFHGIFFWIILFILSFYYKIFFWIFIGIAIHIFADIIDLVHNNEKIYNKVFPCYVIRRNKNKRSLKDL